MRQLETDLIALKDKALQMGASAVKVVNIDGVKTGAWTRIKCQYGCPNYGSNLCCPPYTPTYEQMQQFLAEYSKGLLVEYTFTLSDQDNCDFAAADLSMSNGLLEILLALEKTAFLQNHYRAFALKAGRCCLCEKCNLQKCVQPVKARPSLEACGIDVFALAKDNGFNMRVIEGSIQELKIYGLLLLE